MKPVSRMTKKERAAVLCDPNAKLSDLLEISARDAIALQKQKRVSFDMKVYVQGPYRGSPKCEVCLFGAALFRDLGIKHAPDISFFNDPDLEENARRVNSARDPSWEPEITAAEFDVLSPIVRAGYSDKLERAPFRVYLTAARKLREAGL